jgi:putative transcriptional regulator
MSSLDHRNRFMAWIRVFACCVLSLIALTLADHSSSAAAERDRFLAGRLLVATPEMNDPRFAESVIYVVKHESDGAMGLVINKPMTKVPIDELLKGFGLESKNSKRGIVIHYGGPVGVRQGFLLHSDDSLLDSSTKVSDGVAMTADAKLLELIARGKGPRRSLFMLGYAGWGPGQLENELKANSWFVIRGELSLIFGNDADKKWRQALDRRQIPL